MDTLKSRFISLIPPHLSPTHPSTQQVSPAVKDPDYKPSTTMKHVY